MREGKESPFLALVPSARGCRFPLCSSDGCLHTCTCERASQCGDSNSSTLQVESASQHFALALITIRAIFCSAQTDIDLIKIPRRCRSYSAPQHDKPTAVFEILPLQSSSSFSYTINCSPFNIFLHGILSF